MPDAPLFARKTANAAILVVSQVFADGPTPVAWHAQRLIRRIVNNWLLAIAARSNAVRADIEGPLKELVLILTHYTPPSIP